MKLFVIVCYHSLKHMAKILQEYKRNKSCIKMHIHNKNNGILQPTCMRLKLIHSFFRASLIKFFRISVLIRAFDKGNCVALFELKILAYQLEIANLYTTYIFLAFMRNFHLINKYEDSVFDLKIILSFHTYSCTQNKKSETYTYDLVLHYKRCHLFSSYTTNV